MITSHQCIDPASRVRSEGRSSQKRLYGEIIMEGIQGGLWEETSQIKEQVEIFI